MRGLGRQPGTTQPVPRPELERLAPDRATELRVIVDSITMTLESMRVRGQLRPEVAGNIMALLTQELHQQTTALDVIRRYQEESRGMDPA